MPRGLKTFEKVMEEAKKVMAEHNLSLDEVEQNTGVEQDFIRILFDPTTRTSENISKIFEFLKIRLFTQNLLFTPYNVLSRGNIYRISRVIHPKCTMFYDRKTDTFYKFKYKLKTQTHSEVYTDIIKNEMRQCVYQHILNK